jgi:hypothetical protein
MAAMMDDELAVRRQRARRTAWMVAAFAAAVFVLSIVQMMHF